MNVNNKREIIDCPIISLIVPVYNVEKYLDYCIRSILSQNYKNIEVILVDDGSRDKSGKICDDYAKKDSRVRVIHKENGGLSSARNEGIKYITGEYFTFIDSDDYIRKDYISKMYERIMLDNSDIVIGGVKKVLENRLTDAQIIESNIGIVYDQNEIKHKILSRKIPIYAICKLFKKKFADNMKFPIGRLYEDIPTIWNILQYAQKVSVIEEEIYFYRQRRDSIVNINYTHRRMDQLYFSEYILNQINEGNELYYVGISRCFFSAADNYALVTEEYEGDKKYLEGALRKYAKGVLHDSSAEKELKVMAVCSFISVKMVRVIGKLYKKYQFKKLT